MIDKVAILENAESGWATSFGMAAVFTTFAALLQSGDHIVYSRSVFGSTHRLFTEIFTNWEFCFYFQQLYFMNQAKYGKHPTGNSS